MRDWPKAAPVVSILCATYNHEEYIDDAMRGFLSQVTSFPFEIIVRDDASTDRTARILERYATAYPALIRVIQEQTNTYRDHKPFDVMRPLARGEFIAVCEGDDYWSDPGKLETQVSYLRNHPDCVLVHHQAFVIRDGEVESLQALSPRHQKNISGRSMQRGGAVMTSSIVHRNIPFDSHPFLSRIWNGDQILLMQLGYHGQCHFLQGPPRSAYRVHSAGVWSTVSDRDRAVHSAMSFYWIAQWFVEKGDYGTAAYCVRRSVLALVKGFGDAAWRRMKPFPPLFRAISILNFRRGLEWFQRVTR